jgi:hypothetical protein
MSDNFNRIDWILNPEGRGEYPEAPLPAPSAGNAGDVLNVFTFADEQAAVSEPSNEGLKQVRAIRESMNSAVLGGSKAVSKELTEVEAVLAPAREAVQKLSGPEGQAREAIDAVDTLSSIFKPKAPEEHHRTLSGQASVQAAQAQRALSEFGAAYSATRATATHATGVADLHASAATERVLEMREGVGQFNTTIDQIIGTSFRDEASAEKEAAIDEKVAANGLVGAVEELVGDVGGLHREVAEGVRHLPVDTKLHEGITDVVNKAARLAAAYHTDEAQVLQQDLTQLKEVLENIRKGSESFGDSQTTIQKASQAITRKLAQFVPKQEE